jgi:ABC-type multidrug transport system ATPase subunit
MMKTTISINNISKSYKGKPSVTALTDINLQITEGELFGLIGPDGAGKTSLFRILTTLLLADKGTATVDGEDVVKDFREIRNHIGYMPGRFSLYQDLTIEENLNFFADVFDTTIEANYDMIRDIYVQIEPFKRRRAGKLSGGMKQKLALCCALIHKPKVLFLDEPTTGVDPVSRKEFWEMLKGLKKQNITIMVSTPYMDEASLCDRIALIQSGKIMSVNTPEKIVSDYPFILYEAKAENNYHLLEKLKTQDNVRLCYISGEYLHLVFKDDDTHIDFPHKELKKVEPTVEDCFIQLML